jgi:hypothetical protein
MKGYIVKCVDGTGKVDSRRPLVGGKAEVQLLFPDGTPVFEDGKPKKILVAPSEFVIVKYL